jgi:hypothetical protein
MNTYSLILLIIGEKIFINYNYETFSLCITKTEKI